MSTNNRWSSSRSPFPELPAQPDHFYGNEDIQFPPSPSSDGRTWLDPADDPAAQRGIPVFKPTLEEFQDFEGYMHTVEPWGMRSGIVKIIPPKDWTDTLPSVVPQLDRIKLKLPIEQHMVGQGGLFQQQNIEKRRVLSVREWAELCAKDDMRAPGVDETGLHARAQNGVVKTRTRRGRRANMDAPASENGHASGDGQDAPGRDARESETAEPDTAINVKSEDEDEHVPVEHGDPASALISPPNTDRALSPVDNVEDGVQQWRASPSSTLTLGPSQSSKRRHPLAEEDEEEDDEEEMKQSIDDEIDEGTKPEDVKPRRGKRTAAATRETKEAQSAERAEKDREFLESFDPHTAWLPPNTMASSYTAEFCKELERRYWRNCGFGKPPWYGADMQGSLFTDETTAWNVAHLPSALTRLLPASSKGLPGVNTPYLYFGMWRATFAWHVEDMDLFSINYIHFGAPKFWYAMPQARANALEQTMRSLFPGAGKNCSQFLRHKSYLASPTLLSKSACRPNHLVQRAGEFVITFPRGYHAGFNLGFNCAESVNFALDSWLDLGRKAKACECVNFSVRIDVDQLLQDRAAENCEVYFRRRNWERIEGKYSNDVDDVKATVSRPRKRKSDGTSATKPKKRKAQPSVRASEQPVASSSKVQIPVVKTIRVTLKLPPPPKPKEPDTFPCCLCASISREGLLRVQDPPIWWYEPGNVEAAAVGSCMAHVQCATVVPETWVDEVETGEPDEGGVREKERVVFGVDAIVKDRWNLKCTACTKPKNRMHGAPIQCTKGKCPKAFHVSCARDGAANGIVYRELREVEKEVVLMDAQPQPQLLPQPQPQPSNPAVLDLCVSQLPTIGPTLVGEQLMNIDSASPGLSAPNPQTGSQPSPLSSSHVLKTIKKTEVEVLCHQHNPDILAAKKAQQQDRIRNALVALPPMSRIKLRVTAGVFEVTLTRVIEETYSVEVLWDRGLKREFKWRGVVFGETDNVVGSKPTEPAPEPPQPPVPTSHPPLAYRPPPSAVTTAAALPAVHNPTHVSSSPAPSSSTVPMYTQASGTAVPYQRQYHYPPTAAYQYAPGSWAQQYSQPSSSHPSYPPSGGPSYPSSSGPPPSSSNTNPYAATYAQSLYGQPPAGYYPYTSTPQQTVYPQYPQNNGNVPTQTGKPLQWQQPYVGPRQPAAAATKPPSSAAPAYPQYYGYPPTALGTATVSSCQAVAPAPPVSVPAPGVTSSPALPQVAGHAPAHVGASVAARAPGPS